MVARQDRDRGRDATGRGRARMESDGWGFFSRPRPVLSIASVGFLRVLSPIVRDH
jgi:hypothetical protein